MRRNGTQFLARTFLALAALQGWPRIDCQAEQFDGYTEPYDLINVAAPETGIVKAVLVREGQHVRENEVLAQLDDELHLSLLSIAEQSMLARGELNSALTELQLQQHRLEKLQAVRNKGYARQEEVERAAADVAIAEARVLTARENLIIKTLEHKRIQIQIARRSIRSPMDGVITKVHKEKGEYVGPNDPDLVEMVRLNPLRAKFSLPSQRARQLAEGQTVTLYLEPTGQTVRGTIDFIGPVADAESATVQIKVRIDNPDGKVYSGEHCTIELGGQELAQLTE